MERDYEERKEKNYFASAFIGFLTIVFFNWLFPGVIPFGTFELWKIKQGNWLSWLIAAWPIFAWCVLANVICSALTRNDPCMNKKAESLFGIGILISLWAGFVEEIAFRWLIFLGAIPGVKIANFLFFGWLGFGLPAWFQVHLAGPIANFFSLGGLNGILTEPSNWAMGAALLSTNTFFRDGHKYQGWFGWLNSWFIGMFLFWMLFKYGLLACILVHFAYDFLCFFVRYIDMVLERKMC